MPRPTVQLDDVALEPNRRTAATPRARKGRRTARRLSLVAVSLAAMVGATLTATPATAASPGYIAAVAAAPGGGVWVHASPDYTAVVNTNALGGAPNLHSRSVEGSVVTDPAGAGYYLVDYNGTINRYGSPEPSPWRSFTETGYRVGSGSSITNPVMAVTMTPTGRGMWALDRQGHVWGLGDAPVLGDHAGHDQIPADIVGTPSGKGYYILENDGGVFTFGDAVFLGSTGGKKPGGQNATGIALSLTEPYCTGGYYRRDPRGPVWVPRICHPSTVDGYWMVGQDGTIVTFGRAPFYGSTGGYSVDQVTDITTLPDRGGYAIAHQRGSADVFTPNGVEHLEP